MEAPSCPEFEVDCPWFDQAWLVDHPDFPLAPALVPNDSKPVEEGEAA